MLELNLIGENITIEKSNYMTSSVITLKGEGLNLEIHIDQSNLEYLKQTLSPNGLMPDSFEGQINMMNQLIEELEDIRDKENPDWELSKVEYIGGDEDMIYFETREVE